MRILVTGGAGYIGSQTAKLLAHLGHEPIVYDDLRTGHGWAVKWGPFVEAALADYPSLVSTFRRYRVEAVIHFAASAYVGESARNPDKYFTNNVCGTLSLLNAMREAGVERLIFSSTCASYGTPERLPIRENDPQKPINPYGESKLFVERMLHWYGEAYGLRWAALRYFNAAGADPDGETGELHTPETHLIPLALHATAPNGPVLDVYGNDYPTEDGSAVRDYIHVGDLAAAHVRTLEYLCAGGQSRAFNVGTGSGYSVLQVIAEIERQGGKPVRFRQAPRREGDPPILIADASAAATVLQWRPAMSDLPTIIKTAWAWHGRHFGSVHT